MTKWAKHTFTLGRADYQRMYEPILYGWRDGNDHYWCGARDQGAVWFFDKPARNDLHPTMKPVALVERAIRNSSKSRDIVLDPFGGPGSTLILREGGAAGAACGAGSEVLRRDRAALAGVHRCGRRCSRTTAGATKKSNVCERWRRATLARDDVEDGEVLARGSRQHEAVPDCPAVR